MSGELEKLRNLREELPDGIGRLSRVVVDNPAPVAITIAGSVVMTRIIANAVKPRNVFEALCTLAVCELVCTYGAVRAVKSGWLPFKVRDEDGRLVPLLDGARPLTEE